jgi:adenylate cyclase
MSETRKIAAILVADVVGYSRLAGADEDRTLARLRGLRSDLIDPAIAAHHGRIFKRTGDGSLIEFRSVVDAVRCAIEVQNGLIERNAGLPPERRIEFRVGIHLGDVVEESDGDLMGDGVNIAARLEGICKPGAICLSEAAYWQVKSRLDLKVSDLGPTQLKNIAEPIRVYSLEAGKPAQPKPATPAELAAPKRRSMLAPLAAGIAALLVLVAGAGWWFLSANRPGPAVIDGLAPVGPSTSAPAEAKHLSIVVLPFANLSGDPGQDYFADGITENLTTDLSRIKGSVVIARNTAFTYKGKSVDAKEIGKELGVRYVLEGSVQRDQNRVRVNAQLIDTESGAHLWADRFEEDMADLFKLQDEIVARLANALGIELVKAEAEKGARSSSPDALDLAMRGWATMWKSYPEQPKEKRDSHNAALALFDQALEANPNQADALAGEAFTHMALFIFAEGPAETDLDAKIIDPADRAIALAPDDMRAYVAKSFYLAITGRPNEALRTADAGLAINPNSAPLLDARTLARIAVGRFEQAKSDAQQAMRLSPRDPEIPNRRMNLGMAELGLGDFEAAESEFQQAIDSGDHSFIPYVNLAAAYALQGKMDEGKSALAQARRLNPDLTIKWLIGHAPNLPPLFEGLRKVGLPEDAPAEPRHLSIVVLPFTNLSGDPAQDYFADGITENLTTDLSRIPNSFVIARNTAFTYKGRSVDAKEIGKELGVRYVLEGSAQRDQNRVRVNAQLIDAESGAHLWADRFEDDVADLFKLQDEVVARLGRSLDFALTKAEADKGSRSKNPDAVDLIMRGNDLMWQCPKEFRDCVHEARALYERALEIDPNDAAALAGSAQTYVFDWNRGWGDPGTDYDAKILVRANQAINLAPDDPRSYFPKAQYLGLSRRPSEALDAANAGLAINPNDIGLLIARAIAENSLGQYEQAKADMERAIRLSPRDSQVGVFHIDLGEAQIGLGHFDAAIDEFRKAIDSGSRPFFAYTNLAAAYAHAGRMEEANAALAEARRLNPAITIKWLKEHTPNLPVSFEGLRKAGLAEE